MRPHATRRVPALPRYGRPTSGRIAGVGGGILAAGGLAFYLLVLRQPTGAEAIESPLPGATSTAPVHANVAPVAVPGRVAPWEATRENTPPVPAGQVPAWQVRPAAPDPTMHMPAAPVAPPDPQTTTPPMDNPGGVNGDRPPRPEPDVP
jgi:hypothetical protein